ncbi:hypothetical protein ACA910_003314 [Epithemia clementina (nom. ined.)]
MFAQLRRLRQATTNHGGLSAIKIPDTSPGTWKLIIDPDEITANLISRNNRHFSQATGTPFTVPPLRDTVGRNAEQGLASIPEALELDENTNATNTLLQHLTEYTLPPISTTFLGSELQQSFRRWRQSTSTSPHGTHLGHYRALISLDPCPTTLSQDDPTPTTDPRHTSRRQRTASIRDQRLTTTSTPIPYCLL